MTAMPELVAGFHSLVGLAAVFVAISAFLNPQVFNLGLPGNIKLASLIEMSIGASDLCNRRNFCYFEVFHKNIVPICNLKIIGKSKLFNNNGKFLAVFPPFAIAGQPMFDVPAHEKLLLVYQLMESYQ